MSFVKPDEVDASAVRVKNENIQGWLEIHENGDLTVTCRDGYICYVAQDSVKKVGIKVVEDYRNCPILLEALQCLL